jgi:uncharacterized protein
MDKQTILALLAQNKRQLWETFGVTKVALFGSFSKGMQNEGSDVDIAFEVEESVPFGWTQKLRLEEFLENLFHSNVDVVRLKYMDPVIRFQVEDELIYV